MANNLVTVGVKLLAKKTEAIMYTEGAEAQPLDANEVWRYRWAPRIRNYDDDNVKPEEDGDKKDETKADTKDNGGGDDNTTTADLEQANAQAAPAN